MSTLGLGRPSAKIILSQLDAIGLGTRPVAIRWALVSADHMMAKGDRRIACTVDYASRRHAERAGLNRGHAPAVRQAAVEAGWAVVLNPPGDRRTADSYRLMFHLPRPDETCGTAGMTTLDETGVCEICGSSLAARDERWPLGSPGWHGGNLERTGPIQGQLAPHGARSVPARGQIVPARGQHINEIFNDQKALDVLDSGVFRGSRYAHLLEEAR